MFKKKNIGELLIECGRITIDDLEEGLKAQKEFNLKLGETLIKLGKVTKDDIEWILSKQLDIPFVIVENFNLYPDLISRFPKELLIKNRVLPLYETDEEIAIATDDPLNRDAFDLLEKLSDKKIKLSSGNGEKIEEILMHFFKRDGVPSLMQYIQSLLERLEGTSFYRIDFILGEHHCEIYVYGSGILRKVAVLNAAHNKDQIFHSFESLDIGFLYEMYSSEKILFLSIYPITHIYDTIPLPAIVGTFGLIHPDGITFADLKSDGLPQCIRSDKPVKGHIFLSTKSSVFDYEQTIFTADSAPQDFVKYFIRMVIPAECGSCSGKGCGTCKELGYVFDKKIEGVYSSDELKHIVHEGGRWQK
jgi:hypothetical protein